MNSNGLGILGGDVEGNGQVAHMKSSQFQIVGTFFSVLGFSERYKFD